MAVDTSMTPGSATATAIRCSKDMTEDGGDGIRERISSRGEEALGELAQFLIDNPWVNQALQVAFGARERASAAGASAIRNLILLGWLHLKISEAVPESA